MQIFRHQVGGHFPLLWQGGKVCKPAVPRELDFYSNLEKDLPAMVPYVPKYHGVTYIERASDLISNESKDDEPYLSQEEESISGDNRGRKRRTQNQHVYNVWARDCFEKRREQLVNKIKYIVLEDLAFPYVMPNIMDLKLGVRQHGLEDSPDKVKRKRLRCAMSTSASLGLRLGGMQSYRPLEGKYLFRDKYYGRGLNQVQFLRTLHEFFSDGNVLLKDTIQTVLTQVREFSQIISQETRYRFYSSSLLLVFEGHPSKLIENDGEHKEGSEDSHPNSSTGSKKGRRVDIRMIDFARTWKLPGGDDDGLSKGFESLISCLEKLLNTTIDSYDSVDLELSSSSLSSVHEDSITHDSSMDDENLLSPSAMSPPLLSLSQPILNSMFPPSPIPTTTSSSSSSSSSSSGMPFLTLTPSKSAPSVLDSFTSHHVSFNNSGQSENLSSQNSSSVSLSAPLFPSPTRLSQTVASELNALVLDKGAQTHVASSSPPSSSTSTSS
jgi:inositol-hexakisphosphate kinase